MAWYPIAFLPPQYENSSGAPYSGAVLKAYAEGTSTPISMATDNTGSTTAASFALNASGFPVSGGAVIIPHVDQDFKLALYPTQTAADANSGAIWTVDNISVAVLSQTTSTTPVQGDSSTNIATTEFFGQNLPGGFVNVLRNPVMEIWQRGTSMNVTTSGAYTSDGWIVEPSGATVVVARANGNGASHYALQITGAASVTNCQVRQNIESFMAVKLYNKRTTFQALIYNDTGASITPTLTVRYANAQDNFSAATDIITDVNLQACANGAWTRVAYTFDAGTSVGNGAQVIVKFGNNLPSGSDVVRITELDLRPTPGVATGQNAAPPPIEWRPTAVEQLLSERYLPAYNATSGSVTQMPTSGSVFSTTIAVINYIFRTPARVPVTGITVSSVAHFNVVSGTVNAAVDTSMTIVRPGSDCCGINCTMAGATYTVGYGAILTCVSASGRILFTGAEL